jgi:hypothetical protein
MTAARPHRCADPRLCPDCRRERLTGRPVPTLRDMAALLASAPERAPLIEEDDVDYAEVLRADMRRILDRVGWAALHKADLRALLHAAMYGMAPPADVVMRAAEALAEEPHLYVISANAVPPDAPTSDHGDRNSTDVD